MKILELNLGEVYRYKSPNQNIKFETGYLEEYAALLKESESIPESLSDIKWDALHKNAVKNGLSIFGIDKRNCELITLPSELEPEHDFKVGVFADRDEEGNGLDLYLQEKTGRGLREMFDVIKDWPYHTQPNWSTTYEKLMQVKHILFKNNYMNNEWYSDAFLIVIETVAYAINQGWNEQYVIRWNRAKEKTF